LLALQLLFSGLRKGIIFGTAVILGLAPLGGDPALLFQAVERGVKRTLIDLQHLFGDLADALSDGPASVGLLMTFLSVTEGREYRRSCQQAKGKD
jgi:hypothetical protein